MHEASIMQSVFEIACDRMEREGANRIHRLKLRVGAYSGVVVEALMFAFDALKADTPAADATLEVEFVPLRLYCAACDREFASEAMPAICPGCGDWNCAIRQGQELALVSLEVSREE